MTTILKASKNPCFLILVFICLFSVFSFSQETDYTPTYELGDINFTGNESFKSSTLEEIINSRETPGWFSQFLNSFSSFGGEAVYFDSLLISSDLAQIKNFYWSKGFFKVSVNAKYVLYPEHSEAELTFYIKENKPFEMNAFTVSGLSNIYVGFANEIRDQIRNDSGEVYQSDVVLEHRDYILTYLRDRGYMLAKIDEPVIKVDTMQNIVDLNYNVNTGKLYKISEVRTEKTGEGKDLIEDKLIKDIVGMKKDDTYHYYEIQKSQIRLYRTNLFTSAVVNGVVSDTSNGTVPLNIATNIGLMHEISPEFIFNNRDETFNLGLGAEYTRKNFLGNARKLTLGASVVAQDPTDIFRNLSVTDTTLFGYADARIGVEEPFLFGKNINTRYEIYTTLQKRRNDYNATLFGGKITLNFDLPRYTYFNTLITYFNYENSKYIFRNLQLNDSTSISNFELRGINGILGVEFAAIKTNDYLFPTEGYNLSFLLEDGNSILYALDKISNFIETDPPVYYKTQVTGTFFFPVIPFENSTLGLKLKIGHIQAYKGDENSISINQRFYSGGSNSIRGWRNRDQELAPEKSSFNSANVSYEDVEAQSRNVVPGGFFNFEGSIEARTRLIGDIGSALFLDFGHTLNSYKDFRPDRIALAGGFGIRYYSPIAPFRLDFGFKLYNPATRQNIFEYDKGNFWTDSFQIHLGIGEAF